VATHTMRYGLLCFPVCSRLFLLLKQRLLHMLYGRHMAVMLGKRLRRPRGCLAVAACEVDHHQALDVAAMIL
jgi:hypothetical protein